MHSSKFFSNILKFKCNNLFFSFLQVMKIVNIFYQVTEFLMETYVLDVKNPGLYELRPGFLTGSITSFIQNYIYAGTICYNIINR